MSISNLWDEWVLLIQGAAQLDLGDRLVNLAPGDHLLIPAGQKHRVTQTAPDQPTVWQAVHIDNDAQSQSSAIFRGTLTQHT